MFVEERTINRILKLIRLFYLLSQKENEKRRKLRTTLNLLKFLYSANIERIFTHALQVIFASLVSVKKGIKSGKKFLLMISNQKRMKKRSFSYLFILLISSTQCLAAFKLQLLQCSQMMLQDSARFQAPNVNGNEKLYQTELAQLAFCKSINSGQSQIQL